MLSLPKVILGGETGDETLFWGFSLPHHFSGVYPPFSLYRRSRSPRVHFFHTFLLSPTFFVYHPWSYPFLLFPFPPASLIPLSPPYPGPPLTLPSHPYCLQPLSHPITPVETPLPLKKKWKVKKDHLLLQIL